MYYYSNYRNQDKKMSTHVENTDQDQFQHTPTSVIFAYTRELVLQELREIHQKLRFVEKAVFSSKSNDLFISTMHHYNDDHYSPGGDIGAPPRKRMKKE